METTESEVAFKVKEGLAKDVGRSIARLDPEDMKRLGISGGDIIVLLGRRQTLAKVMPCYAEDRGKKIIQIDGVLRENAQVGLDEKIKVEKAQLCLHRASSCNRSLVRCAPIKMRATLPHSLTARL